MTESALSGMMGGMETLLFEILMVCLVATIVVTACHKLKLPTIVGFILTGMVIGPSALGLVSSLPSAYRLTEIVGVILMFTIGLEFSLSKLRELKQPFFRLGIPQVVLTCCVIIGGGYVLTDVPLPKLTLWGFAISLSSTALILKLLSDYGDMQTPLGRNTMGILIMQDIAVIPMLLLLPIFAHGQALSGSEFGASVGLSFDRAVWLNYGTWFLKAFGVVVVLGLFARLGLPRVLEHVVQTRSQELFFFSIIFICLGTGALFHWLGLSQSLGAFVSGLIIAESAFARHTIVVFGSLRDTFLGAFFVTVGMLLDLQFLGGNLGTVVLIGAVFFVIKVGVTTLVCLVQKIPKATALLTGFTLCQVGEFSFLLVSSGTSLGIFDDRDSQYFMAASVLSMVATPFIYMYTPRLVHRYFALQWRGIGLAEPALGDKVEPVRDAVATTIIIGCGIAGHNVAEALSALRISYHIIEMNYQTVKSLQARGYPISFGDATQKETLEHAGIAHARMVVIAASGSEVVGHMVHAIRALRPDLPIIVRAQYVRDLHHIGKDPGIRPVVAEIETAAELVAHVLKNYGVSPEIIFEYTAKVRTQLNSVAESVSGNRYADLDLPSWEVLASLRAVSVGEKDFAVQKTLTDLSLPQVVGASVVAVYRKGQGTIIPDGHFVVRSGDIIHLIGDSEKLDFAQDYLARGIVF